MGKWHMVSGELEAQGTGKASDTHAFGPFVSATLPINSTSWEVCEE
jgi:hypothetical protein